MASEWRSERSSLSSTILSLIGSRLGYRQDELELDKSFVQLGGHSLTALSLSSSLLECGIILPVSSILKSSNLAKLVEDAKEIPQSPTPPPSTPDDASDVSRSSNQVDIWGPTTPETEPASDDRPRKRVQIESTAADDIDLTDMQLALIAGGLRRSGTNMIQLLDHYMPRDVPVVKSAWKRVIEVENLRGINLETDLHGIYKATLQPLVFEWTELYFDTVSDYETELEKPCTDSPISSRFKVMTCCQNGVDTISTVVWEVHHALIDGWSASLLYTKVHRAASGLQITTGSCFREVAREIDRSRKRDSVFLKNFWQRKEEQHPSAAGDLVLRPSSRTPSEALDGTRSLDITLPTTQIAAVAQKVGVTVAAVHYAIWALVLSKFMNAGSVVFGAVHSGRSLPVQGIMNAIGPTVNTLPFYAKITSSMLASEFLRETFQGITELDMIQASIPDDGFSRDFSSALAVEPDISPPANATLRPSKKPTFSFVSDIPINILIGLEGNVKFFYQRDKLKDADAELVSQYYSSAAELLTVPTMSLTTVLENMTPPRTRHHLLQMGNASSNSTTDSIVCQDLVTLFESLARESPSAVALEKGVEEVTYQDLDCKASVIANHLVQHIQEGDVICVHADRSINFIVTIYAILKARGVYAPLDPSLPDETRESYYQISGAKAFIIPNRASCSLQPASCQKCFSIEEVLEESACLLPLSHRSIPCLDANAYICFTSGSTNLPKAVLCHHRGLVAFQMDEQVRLFAKQGMKISQIMSPAFDGSIHEIFSALSYGATLVLPAGESGIEQISRVHSAILTPSLARVLSPQDFPLLRYVYFVGEHVPQSINDNWTAAKDVYNMYGPTEATCGATIKKLEYGMPVTIGHPNPTTRVYILDQNRRLLPPGCVGDIYLAGVQVSRGYIGQPQTTFERFTLDPFDATGMQRMYQTGDCGFWDESGEINFTGRNDRQIKLNGFRLDLNAIEESIAQVLPEAVGVALSSYHGQLIVALQPSSVDCTEARSKLSLVLPPYAMPEKIFALDRFPLTSAGKLDYKKVAACSIANRIHPVLGACPSVAIKIEKIWREILKLDDKISLGPHSDFGLLGGHSLQQVSVANRLSNTFGLDIQMQHIIQRPTFEGLATYITTTLSTPNILSPSSVQFKTLGARGVSSIETEWCLKYLNNPKTSSFNVSLAYKLDASAIDIQRLEKACNDVLGRYPILRSRYVQSSGVFERSYHTASSKVLRPQSIDIENEINRPFHLESEDLIRVSLSQETLLLCASHIICDLTTLRILLNEVVSLYHGRPLQPCERLYGDTTVWTKDSDLNDLLYWERTLTRAKDSKTRVQGRKSFGGRSRVIRLGEELSASITRYLDSNACTAHQMALTAVALALQWDTSEVDLVLGSPYINRSHEDMNVVGLFLEPLLVRVLHMPGSMNDRLETLVQDVRKCSQSALSHVLPFREIMDHLNIEPCYPDHPIFNTMVTFHDDRETELLALPGVSRQMIWSEGAKFELMCEFTALRDDILVLRLEYDDEVFDENKITVTESMIVAAIGLICSNATFDEAQKLLGSLSQGGASDIASTQVSFGAIL